MQNQKGPQCDTMAKNMQFKGCIIGRYIIKLIIITDCHSHDC